VDTTLEITETTIIREFARAKEVIERLQNLGVDVSVDDFGAGFTSLAYLGRLAVSELKLDQTFIACLTTGDRGRAVPLVRATIELGHALNLRVVAEGVEDGATLELLTQLGCDLIQGYATGRPVAAADLFPLPAQHPAAVAVVARDLSRRRPEAVPSR